MVEPCWCILVALPAFGFDSACGRASKLQSSSVDHDIVRDDHAKVLASFCRLFLVSLSKLHVRELVHRRPGSGCKVQDLRTVAVCSIDVVSLAR